jgi:hypothetical protein
MVIQRGQAHRSGMGGRRNAREPDGIDVPFNAFSGARAEPGIVTPQCS